jgi:hypothetical protein
MEREKVDSSIIIGAWKHWCDAHRHGVTKDVVFQFKVLLGMMPGASIIVDCYLSSDKAVIARNLASRDGVTYAKALLAQAKDEG